MQTQLSGGLEPHYIQRTSGRGLLGHGYSLALAMAIKLEDCLGINVLRITPTADRYINTSWYA
jgi:hypothetical protein